MATFPKRVALATGAALCAIALSAAALATNGNPINPNSKAPYTVAVIGDMPYGSAKIAAFPQFIDFINADDKVDLVAHLGDIKSGSSQCTDTYFQAVKDQFSRLDDPLVYTPGDNEWTDCHRANNGAYLPTERLSALRSLFFPDAGETLGLRSKRVLTQASDPAHSDYVENVMWMESKVVFANFNVPGSNDDSLATNPWGAPWNTSAFQAEQTAEQAARDAANLAWLARTFATADANGAAGVVLMLQADMWDGTHAQLDAYDPFVIAVGEAAIEFGKPVLMLVGDSHIFTVDNPYDANSSLHGIHPGTPEATNVTRIIVEGSTAVPDRFEYLRLTISPKTNQLFSWERVHYEFN